MRAQWKYLAYRTEEGGEAFKLFGTAVIHAEFAARAGIALTKIISAGYATAEKECFGGSTSLGLPSRPRKDTAVLRDET